VHALARPHRDLHAVRAPPLRRPGPGRVEDGARERLAVRPVDAVAPGHAHDPPPVPEQAGRLGPGADLGAVGLGRKGVQQAEARPVDPPLVEGHGTVEAGPQRRLQRVELLGGEPGGGPAALQGLEQVVGPDVDLGRVPGGPLRQGGALGPRREGHQEGDAEDEVRGDPADGPRVPAGELGHAPVGHHVADAAVDHPGAGSGGTAREVVLLEQEYGEAAHGAVRAPRRPRSPLPEDDDVVALRLPHARPACGGLLRGLHGALHVQLPELPRVHVAGRARHQVRALLGLGQATTSRSDSAPVSSMTSRSMRARCRRGAARPSAARRAGTRTCSAPPPRRCPWP